MVEDHEKRLTKVERVTDPLPVLRRDVEQGFHAVDRQFNSVNERFKNLTRVLWIFVTAFLTAAVSVLILALQIATR